MSNLKPWLHEAPTRNSRETVVDRVEMPDTAIYGPWDFYYNVMHIDMSLDVSSALAIEDRTAPAYHPDRSAQEGAV